MNAKVPAFVTVSQIEAAVDARDVLASQAAAFRLAAHPSVTAAQGHATSEDGYLVFLHGARLPDGTTVFKSGVQRPPGVRGAAEPVQASVTLHNADDGRLTHVLDGPTVTALRTAGGLLLCLTELQHRSATVLGILGSGRQARELRRLAEALGSWDQVIMWSPGLGSRAATTGIPQESLARDAESLCRRSDTIACCTSSLTPVLEAEWLREDATVGTMGSYTFDRCETGLDVTEKAALVVTDSTTALTSVGPLVEAIDRGSLRPSDVELMANVLSRDPAWYRPEGVVLVHCSGLGVQDATLSKTVVDRLVLGSQQ